MKNEWYRNTTWNEHIASLFEARLARSRSSKSEYLRIQSLMLAETRIRELAPVALNLAARYFQLNASLAFATQVYLTKAFAYETLGQLELAVQAYRDATQSESTRPNVRDYAHIRFLWFVANHQLEDYYLEAVDSSKKNMRDTDLIFPLNQYRFFAALACIQDDLGDDIEAAHMAKNALFALKQRIGPFEQYPELGLAQIQWNSLIARLESLAVKHLPYES